MNLLNYYHHNNTKYFLDSLVMLNLYPCINQPARITTATATLIDNFFTNSMSSISRCSIIINDATDHLPIFLLSSKYTSKKENDNYLCLRKQDELSMEKFIYKLNQENWNCVYSEDNVNIANSNFIGIFSKNYNENCPIQKILFKNIKKDKPWIASDLRHACENKKCLYIKFLKDSALCHEQQYKTYKNKLTSILIYCEKNYFSDLLNRYSKNTKETWKILNSITNTKN